MKNERDDERDTALTLAAYFADKDTVQFLIEEIGMNPTETGFQGRNCFLSAVRDGTQINLGDNRLPKPTFSRGGVTFQKPCYLRATAAKFR